MKTTEYKGTKKFQIEKINHDDIRIILNDGAIDMWFGGDFDGYPTKQEAIANARLLIAAPNLLKAAISAYVAIKHEPDPSKPQLGAYFALEKAINKALGIKEPKTNDHENQQ